MVSSEYVITLVHGTFARGAAWTSEGSLLRKKISERLATVRFEQFLWSGGNSHSSRLAAGRKLADLLARLRASEPNARHFVVSHSHGGNVALHAAAQIRESAPLAGVACLATPFVDCSRRDIQHSFPFVPWALALATLLLSFVVFYKLARELDFVGRLWPNMPSALELTLFLMVTLGPFVIAIFLAFTAYKFGKSKLRNLLSDLADQTCSRLSLPRIPELPIFVATFPRDEAAVWLSFAERGAGLPFAPWRYFATIGTFVVDRLGLLVLFIICLAIAGGIIEGAFEVSMRDQIGNVVAGLLVYGFFGAMFASAILLLLITFVPIVFRGHELAFGWEGFFTNLVVRFTCSREPPGGKLFIHLASVPPPTFRHFLRRHSAIYGDAEVLNALAKWIEDNAARPTQDRPTGSKE